MTLLSTTPSETSAAGSISSQSREPGDVWFATLTANLESLRRHRPPVYALLESCTTVVDPTPAAGTEEQRVADAFNATDPARKIGRAIALAGSGDGSLLRAFARFAPTLQLGRQQEVNVIEPDLSRLLGTLGCVDLTGPRGPIEQRRFAWYVGAAWEAQLCDDLINQPTKIPPQRAILGGVEERPEVDEGLARILKRLEAEDDARAQRIHAHYEAKDDQELLSAISPAPARQPRVLLITSQFSTVLQYSTYDTADAFRQLGWETHVVTELSPWHLMTTTSIVAAIDSFQPDLVFHIDHLRYELGDAIPDKLPFVCWIQDHLVNLTSTRAASTIGERDFCLTGGTYRYVGRYGYPRRQCVDMPKVARPPVNPASWNYDREDMLYVSHWSTTPEQIVIETCARVREHSGDTSSELMRRCMAEVTGVYAEGGAMRTELELRGIVRRIFKAAGEQIHVDSERFYTDVLFQRLNNSYYRQQALLWAGRIADEFDLKFGIYGMGWDKHPELGRFARGVVRYGPDLEALTRQSKILLQLEPYGCYTHQRMLDCLLAGGFALIRHHPLNTLPVKVRKFLDAHVPPEVNDVATAREFLDESQSKTLDALLDEARIITDVGDLVDVVRGWQRAGTIGNGDEILPHLDAIKFDSFETLRDRVKTFVNDDAARRDVSAEQRECVMDRLTYRSAISRAMTVVHSLLRETIEAAPAQLPEPSVPALEAA